MNEVLNWFAGSFNGIMSTLQHAVDWLLISVQTVEPGLRMLLTGVAVFCETSILLGVLLPGDAVMLVSATATGGWLEYLALIFVGIIGALIGESLGFILGHWLGPKLQHSKIGQKIGQKHWQHAQLFLDRRGGPAIFASRFLPVLHSLIPVTAGMSTMRYHKFIAWTAPACALWAILYSTVGWLASGSYQQLRKELHWAGFIFVGIIVIFTIAIWLVKKVLLKSQQRHMLTADNVNANGSTLDISSKGLNSNTASLTENDNEQR